MALSPALLASWDVPSDLPPGPLATAAHELALHLAKVAPIPGDRIAGQFVFIAGDAPGDGFLVVVAPGQIELRGDSPRGCLNAVYWLLEQLGFAWLEPGPLGERFVPDHELLEGEHRQDPAFARRTLVLGNDALHDQWPAWLQWASRNRLNDIFFHDTPPSRFDRGPAIRPVSAEDIAADGGGWLFERWDVDSPAIRAAASEAGMTIQFGGHHLAALLEREQFALHPDWFPMRNGVRDARYNLCVSSEGGVAHLRSRAREFFARFAGAAVYHLFADDIRGGGWCECGPCAAVSPSDQALQATNILAEVLAELVPNARIAYLAYHDTLLPPTEVRPRENVSLLFAPRERCYAHAINDPACERNVPQYWAPFMDLRPLFANDPARIDIFEYYSDAILFKWLAPPLLGVQPLDAAAYAAAGAGNLQNLMVSPRPWIGPPWHAWWMARCAWDPALTSKAALAQFCAGAYPGHAQQLAAYYQDQESACQKVLDLHDLQPALRRDVLDFSSEPRETMRAKVADLADAALLFDELHRRIRDLAAPGLASETQQAELQWRLVAHLAHRMAAWRLSLGEDGAGGGEQAQHSTEASTHLAWLEEWERASNPPAYANLSRPMLNTMRHYTRALA